MIQYSDIDPHHELPSVLVAIVAAWGISLTDVELILKIISLLAAIGFTTFKFYVALKKHKEDNQNKNK